MQPFGIVSDQHFHEFSAFASTNANGVNTRLQYKLNELRRCADEVRKAGGNIIINAGDTFHTRGSLAPSVLNPVMDLHRELIAEGFEVHILAGNHDLASKESNRLNSAVTALEGIGCHIKNEPMLCSLAGKQMLFVPWIQNIAQLKSEIERMAIIATVETPLNEVTLIIHAPIDGVIPGLPDHGLSGEWLTDIGFQHVFSGHYHNHKEVVPNKVWSIGATTHQTWSDVGAKAGFLIVSDADVRWHASHAPSFVEIDGSTDPDEIALIVDGNFAKVRITSSKSSDVNAIKQFLTDSGALGVTVMSVPEVVISARASGTVLKSGATLESSIDDFIGSQVYKNKPMLSTLCQSILTTVRSTV
jgi:DNA repair exonuclease SbcCD nuclease subunit